MHHRPPSQEVRCPLTDRLGYVIQSAAWSLGAYGATIVSMPGRHGICHVLFSIMESVFFSFSIMCVCVYRDVLISGRISLDGVLHADPRTITTQDQVERLREQGTV